MRATQEQFIRESVTAGREVFPSVTYVPPDYSGDAPYPVILYLHGAGEAGADGDKQTRMGIGVQLRLRPALYPAIVVMPQSPGPWRGANLEMALRALDQAREQLNADPNRLYITGVSMGGFGTWDLAAAHPELFAAAVPICGGGNPQRMAPRLVDLPIWAWHGAADDVVPVAHSREMVKAIRKLGGKKIRYTELPGVTHNSWDAAYGDPELARWMLEQKRQ